MFFSLYFGTYTYMKYLSLHNRFHCKIDDNSEKELCVLFTHMLLDQLAYSS